MSESGWLPAWRKVYEPDHWLAPTKRDPASRRDAWLDLCQMATWQPRETRSSGTLQRGELMCSIRTLARRWVWHRSKVERFLNELKTRTSLGTVRETQDGTVYHIVNYELYAVSENGKRDSQRDAKRDSGETAARQEQEVKHSSKKQVLPSLRSGSASNGNGNGALSKVAGAWNGGDVMDAYVQYCRSKGWPDPPNGQRGKLGAAGKRLAAQQSPSEIVRAMIGMGSLYPHSNGEPWDLMDLERKFTKASAAAVNDPTVERERFRRAFLEGA